MAVKDSVKKASMELIELVMMSLARVQMQSQVLELMLCQSLVKTLVIP